MKPIYLDYAATTPVDPRVLEAMLPWFGAQSVGVVGDGGNDQAKRSNKRSDRTTQTSQLAVPGFGNPGSLHSYGQKASAAVFKTRQEIAKTIGAHYSEIIFTGSATEANNLALRGALKKFLISNFQFLKGKKPRIIISAIEHESVLKTAQDLARDGADVVIIPVSKEGIIDLKKLKVALNDRTALVSVMFANNETGVVQPIAEISKMVREFRGDRSWPLLHTDAAQAFNYMSCNVDELGVDLMTLSAQKIYGPKGVGCLYVRSVGNVKNNSNKPSGQTTPTIHPIITGGGQEQGLRSGTENVPVIVGFGEAVKIAEGVREKESARLMKLRDMLIADIKRIWTGAKLNGSAKLRLPNNINMHLPGTSAEETIVALDLQGIAVSSGSACTARSPEASHVLIAMGASKEVAKNSIRITLGRQTTAADLALLVRTLAKLRR